MFDFLKRAIKKSGGTDPYDLTNFFKVIQGDTSVKNYTAQDLVKMNKGWVAVCNNKNALTIATTPLHLYYNNRSGKKVQLLKNKTISKKDFEHIVTTVNDATIKQAEEIIEIQEHPFLDVLKKVNPQMNYVDLITLVESYLGILGNSYVRIVFGRNDQPKELYPLLSENVSVITNDAGEVIGYKYVEKTTNQSGVTERNYRYTPKEIIHFKNYKPGCLLYGIGELEQCLAAVERMNYYDVFESFLNRNYSRNDFIVAYKGRYTEKEMKDAYKQWSKRFSGVQNAGKPLVTAGELDIKTLGFAPKEMEWIQGRNYGMKEIAAAFGVPESIISLNDANRASSVTSTIQYYKFTLIPKIRQLCEKLNEQLLPLYDSNLFLWYSESDFIPKESPTYPDILKAVELGILTNEEARSNFGYSTLKE